MTATSPRKAQTANGRTLAEVASSPTRLTKAQAERLDARSQDEIDAAADADPVAPTWTDAMLSRAEIERVAREHDADLRGEGFNEALKKISTPKQGKAKT